MKKTILTVALVSAAIIASVAQTVWVGGEQMYPTKDIIDNAVNSSEHTTLVAAVKAAGLVETADRQRDHVFVESAGVLLGNLLLHAAQANARDARRHAGEELVDQRAREADRLEVAAAAIRRQDGDAHLGHDLE